MVKFLIIVNAFCLENSLTIADRIFLAAVLAFTTSASDGVGGGQVEDRDEELLDTGLVRVFDCLDTAAVAATLSPERENNVDGGEATVATATGEGRQDSSTLHTKGCNTTGNTCPRSTHSA